MKFEYAEFSYKDVIPLGSYGFKEKAANPLRFFLDWLKVRGSPHTAIRGIMGSDGKVSIADPVGINYFKGFASNEKIPMVYATIKESPAFVTYPATKGLYDNKYWRSQMGLQAVEIVASLKLNQNVTRKKFLELYDVTGYNRDVLEDSDILSSFGKSAKKVAELYPTESKAKLQSLKSLTKITRRSVDETILAMEEDKVNYKVPTGAVLRKAVHIQKDSGGKKSISKVMEEARKYKQYGFTLSMEVHRMIQETKAALGLREDGEVVEKAVRRCYRDQRWE